MYGSKLYEDLERIELETGIKVWEGNLEELIKKLEDIGFR